MLITLLLLLLIARNIKPNPGPIKYPCGQCGKPCKSKNCIQCDTCEMWTHWKCTNSATDVNEYIRPGNCDDYWHCPKCILPNFTDSFFNELSGNSFIHVAGSIHKESDTEDSLLLSFRHIGGNDTQSENTCTPLDFKTLRK